MADLTLVSANTHNEKSAVNWLRARSRKDAPDHFDIACVYEAHARRRQLRALPGHDYLTGDQPGMSQSTGILLDRRLPQRGHAHQFVSPATERGFKSVGKERWGHVVLTELAVGRGVPVAVIALHPVAGPAALAGSDPTHPLVRRYAMAVRWLEVTIAYHVAQGHEYVICMDAQMFAAWERPWSLHPVFAEHGTKVAIWHRIDLIAHSPGLVLVGSPSRRVRQVAGQDHPFLVAEFDFNRTKRRSNA